MKIAPLRGSFMIMSMLGMLISILFVYPKISIKFGSAFVLIFLLMFIASIISFIYAPIEDYDYSKIAIKKKK